MGSLKPLGEAEYAIAADSKRAGVSCHHRYSRDRVRLMRRISDHQGLARRHGLIPLPVPITLAVPQSRDEYNGWTQFRRPLSTS